jgi:NRAMP (natural resistance-associated macrophage protein)-like metal ion transporter
VLKGHEETAPVASPSERPGLLGRFWSALGPGVITGAADDDPSGIATYSLAGAQFGTTLLWTALLTWPMMAAVQMMCARIGMVTGRGLMACMRKKFSRRALAAAAVALLLANILNIGADLSGMADGAELLTGLSSHGWVILFGLLITLATVYMRYGTMTRVLKWLVLALFAYAATAFYIHPPWHRVLHDLVTPRVPAQSGGWSTVVAILGTTISPYLFFWQTAEEVEEEKVMGRRTLRQRQGATPDELRNRAVDVGIGTFFSNVVMFFIIVTTAFTLHQHGLTQPTTSREVAEALRPLAGPFATLLYALGIVGTGLLAIPTLSGSAAYSMAEIFGWREGFDERFRRARAFYIVIAFAIAAGAGLDFANVNAVQALYWVAVINGVLAPFLLTGILLAASDRSLMLGQPVSRLARAVVGITTLAMFGAAVAMFA